MSEQLRIASFPVADHVIVVISVNRRVTDAVAVLGLLRVVVLVLLLQLLYARDTLELRRGQDAFVVVDKTDAVVVAVGDEHLDVVHCGVEDATDATGLV